MAERIKRFNYGGGAVIGSLAYDFNYPDLYPEFTLDEPKITAPPLVREKARPKVRTRTKGKQAVAPFALVGYACGAIMIIFLLMAHIQLALISDETVAVQNRLDELRVEETRLLISYESAFNLAEIEEYATKVLGMQKPRSDQVFYVDGSAPDKAVIIAVPEKDNGFFDRLFELILSFGEYFR